jgi:plastocyanin
MRKTILLRLAALSLVALVLFAPTAGAQGKTMTVSIKNFAFNPSNTTVSAGTTLTWVNNDQTAHTVTATNPAGVFDSGTLQPGQSYSFKFDKPGTYAYHCEIHPDMTGTITVSGASGSASASASPSSSASAMATSPTASAITSPTASASTQQLPSSGGSTLELVAGLALVAFAIALVLVLVRRGAAS